MRDNYRMTAKNLINSNIQNKFLLVGYLLSNYLLIVERGTNPPKNNTSHYKIGLL